MRRFLAPLSFALFTAQASAFAVFNVDSRDDTLGTSSKCTLRAAFENINQKSATAGLMPGQNPNPDCPAGQAENFIYFDFPAGASGYPEIKRDPALSPWSLIANKATLVGVLLSGQQSTRILKVGKSASLALEHAWLEEGGGGGSGTAIQVESAETASLRLFDVRIVRNKGEGYGGAVAFTSYGTLDVSKSYFGTNQSTQGYGGALWIGTTTQNVSIVDSTFERNKAALGGGAIVCTNSATPVRMRKVSFRSNEVVAGQLVGGGALANSCRMELSAIEFNNNSTRGNPGGAIDNLSDGRLSVAESSIRNNRAGYAAIADGGGIHSDGDLSVKDTGFQYNKALRGGGIAIGKPATNRTITLANSTFVDNFAEEVTTSSPGRGGAIYIPDVAFKPAADFRFRIINNTIHDNSGIEQVWLEDDGGSDTETILFVNNLLQLSEQGAGDNCSGRVERLKLEAKTGQGVANTQFPGTSCDTPKAAMPVLDVMLQDAKNGGNFLSPYSLPPGGAGGLPTGDYAVCAAVIVNGLDQFANKRLCRQGAVEAPPTFMLFSNSLPY